jgi:lipid-binding SYLF domain-containing protein
MPFATIKTAIYGLVFVLVLTLPAWGADKSKDEKTLKNAAAVLAAMLHRGTVPSGLLATANCVLILHVKQVAVGFGTSGGRGPLICRKGKNFSNHEWSAPAMYTLGGATAGLQFGGSSTDFVTLILSASAANKLLAGKIKVGKSDISATMGAATSTGWVAETDVMAFGRSKGLSAGVPLNGATIESDSNADQRLYDKAVSARDIVLEDAVKPTPAGQSLISLLEKAGPS